MSSAELIDWLDRKLADYGDRKLVPSGAALTDRAVRDIEETLRDRIVDHVLRNARIDEQVSEAIGSVVPALARIELDVEVKRYLETRLQSPWGEAVREIACDLVNENHGYEET